MDFETQSCTDYSKNLTRAPLGWFLFRFRVLQALLLEAFTPQLLREGYVLGSKGVVFFCITAAAGFKTVCYSYTALA